MVSRTAPILVITGPSGAGKTTVSRLVAGTFDRSVHLRVDDFVTPCFVKGWVDPWRPEAAQQNHVVGGATAAAAMELATGGYTVLWDGHLFADGVTGLGAMCAARQVPLHLAMLRPDLATCIARAKQRAASPDHRPHAVFADFDIDRDDDRRLFAELHQRFADMGEHEDKVIDASPAAEQVAAAVLEAFEAGRLRTSTTRAR